MITTVNTNWNPNESIQSRFEKAKKEIRKVIGVRVRVNVIECCRGCVASEKLGIDNDDVAIIWHFGGQGNSFGWDGGLPVNRTVLNRGYSRRWRGESDMESGIYFNHNGLTNGMKNDIVKCFTKYDIVVDWDKSDSQCIYIDFEETRKNDLAVLALIEDAKNAVAVEQDVATMC